LSGVIFGLLHDPETGASRRVELAHDPSVPVLVLKDGTYERRVRADAVSLRTGGWQGTSLHLEWEEEGRRWAVTVENASAEALSAALPEPLAAQARDLVGGALRATRSRTRRTAIALALFVVVPLLLVLAAYLFREQILDAALARLPTSVDAQVGQLVYEQVRVSGQLVESGPAVDAVQALGTRLVAAAPSHPHQFQFHVVRDPSLNAYAAPGGMVVVHTGLLSKADGPDAVAGVLAHEIVHVLHRHSMRQMAFRTGLTGAVQLLVGSPSGAAGVLADAATDLTSLGFSRDQERDADRGGLDLLQKAHLPGEGLVRFFDVLQREGGTPPALLSSHPPSRERSAFLAAEIARRGTWTVEPLTVDWAAVKAQAAGARR
jgi:beta-barrel assembly-enhancing protease